MQTIGWIETVGAFAQKPILGKTCRTYVQEALTDASVTLITERDALQAAPSGVALIVREDAPGLTALTLEGLVNEAAATKRAAVLLCHDMKTPLAIAMEVSAAKEALASRTDLPSVECMVGLLGESGTPPRVWHDDYTDTCFTVTDAESYAEAFCALNHANIVLHQQNGVIILDPERTVIEDGVTIGQGTMIYAGNTLQGRTTIGENCILYPNNRMSNATVGNETTVESSVLLDCVVGASTTVGPYAYLRPKTAVGDHCRIGDFVEVKNSTIGDGTKVSHLTYVGDSDLGKNINLGCGVVFVNYDGKTKNRSTVEDHAFIGCNCNLVAPVHVGENAYLAAGSTVVDDVPADALFVARSRGVVKENWVKRRKEEGKL